jgi:hypothetical protein
VPFVGVVGVVSKIHHESIITQTEHKLLKKFIKERGLHTDISDVYGQTLTSKDQQ